MKKNMLYRIYKKRFADCETLDDYNKNDCTITVIIPDDDDRIKKNPRIDTKVWNSYGNEWRIKEVDVDGCFLKFKVCKDETGYTAWWENRPPFWDKPQTENKSYIKTRQEALNIVLSKWKEFRRREYERN